MNKNGVNGMNIARENNIPKIDFAIFGSTQRCGTTLLQRMSGLNSNFFCWGESGRILDRFVEMQENILFFAKSDEAETKLYLESKNSELWIANMSPNDPENIRKSIVLSLKTLLENLYFPTTPKHYSSIGIKEVGISLDGIHLYRETFPQSKILLVARHPSEVWKSLHLWGYTRESFFDLWEKNTIDYFNSPYPFIWYDDLVNGSANDFLCDFFSLSLEEVRNILQKKVGGTSTEVKELAREEDIEFINFEYIKVLKKLGLNNTFTSVYS